MNLDEEFEEDIKQRLKEYKNDKELQEVSEKFALNITRVKQSYNFYWLGRPVIQGPLDLHAFQEIIWEVKPDFIIEAGVARGGGVVFFASMLMLLEYCKEVENSLVVGLDIKIRDYNKKAILEHPLSQKIKLLEGSSVDESIIKQVKDLAKDKKRVLIILDSNHTHDHVLKELRAYASLVGIGSYVIVCDTGIEERSVNLIGDRPWGKGNSPKSALDAYIKENDNFVIDEYYQDKILVTAAKNGFLKRVK